MDLNSYILLYDLYFAETQADHWCGLPFGEELLWGDSDEFN